MDFRILGPLEVLTESGPVALPRGRARALLALLTLRAGEVVPADRLVDELWGDEPPPTANQGLQNLVSDLRGRFRAAGAGDRASDLLETRAPGYVLRIDPQQVDANRFRRMVEEAADGTAEEAAEDLRAALALWRGPALADQAVEPFAQTEIAALEELRVTAIERRVDADLALGRHGGELIAELEGLILDHPYRERLRGQLMIALYRSGRQAQALEAYRRARQTLVDDLGIEPSPDLSNLEQAILRQDPALAAPGVAGSGWERAARGGVDAAPWLPPGRRMVTVVFANLVEAAGTGAGSDPEVVRRETARSLEAATRIIDHHGGTVEGVIGGVAVALFGLPAAHEDDALRAVRAASELREVAAAVATERAQRLGIRLTARIGISSGEVVVGDPGAATTAVSGGPVGVAARLHRAAGAGEVLVSDATRRLVTGAVEVEPVDAERLGGVPPAAWRLGRVLPGARLLTPDHTSSMVGRSAELARLRTAFDRTAREGRPTLVTVLGEAGVGKSRLAVELTRSLGDDAVVLTGRCPAYGHGIAFWPLGEIVHQLAERRRGDAPMPGPAGDVDTARLAARLAGGRVEDAEPGQDAEPGSGDDGLFPLVRRVIEDLATAERLAIVIDDAHWAQPTLTDLIDHLVGSVAAPLLVVALARPEQLDGDAGWEQRRTRGDVLTLEPLDRDDSERLVTERLAGRIASHDTVERVLSLAQGNPLFLEQLTAALRDDGDLPLPPSLRGLLVARLDRLGPAERDLVRSAAVIGLEFSVEALSALVPDAVRPFLDRHLRALRRKELLEPAPRPFLGRPAFAFRHALIRLAAEASMTREDRADLHERLAWWLERAADDAPEQLVGYHLEQAHLHRRALGLRDEHSRELAIAAGERLARAGSRAYATFDVPGAANLLTRARALLPADHPQRRVVLRELAAANPVLGRHREAEAIISEMLAEASSSDDVATLRLERDRVRLLVGPDPIGLDAIRAGAEQALAAFESTGDQAGAALALFVLALVRRRAGAIAEMEALARRGLAAARSAGHLREESGARWNLAWAVQAGATPAPEALRVCEELAPLGDTLHPGVLCEIAVLRAMLGRSAEARELVARTRGLMVERWHARGTLMYPAAASARVAILAGDVALAADELRAALDMASRMGVRDHVAQLAAELASLLARIGQADEAARWAAVSEEHAPAESAAAQAMRRAAAASVAALDAEHDRAGQLAGEALRLAPRDMLNLRADLAVRASEILVRAGEPDAARGRMSAALRLYERKGNVAGAGQARAAVAELADRRA